MFEAWLSTGGEWSQSSFYMNLKQTQRLTRRGCRRWLLRKEMEDKWGPAAWRFNEPAKLYNDLPKKTTLAQLSFQTKPVSVLIALARGNLNKLLGPGLGVRGLPLQRDLPFQMV